MPITDNEGRVFVINGSDPRVMCCGERKEDCTCQVLGNQAETTSESHASKQAALLSLKTDHPYARTHSLKALDHARAGESDLAESRHLVCVGIHEREASAAELPSRAVGDHGEARKVVQAHKRAADAHKMAASMHAVSRPDEPDDDTDNHSFDTSHTVNHMNYITNSGPLIPPTMNFRDQDNDEEYGEIPGMGVAMSDEEEADTAAEQARRLGFLPLPDTTSKVIARQKAQQPKPVAITPRTSAGMAGMGMTTNSSNGDGWDIQPYPMI